MHKEDLTNSNWLVSVVALHTWHPAEQAQDTTVIVLAVDLCEHV